MTATLLSPRPGAATPPPAAEVPAAAPATGPARRALAAVIRWTARGLVATAVLAFLGLAVGPHVFGYRTMTMLTGSMAPEIEPGDITVVTPLAVEDVAEGMVIAYHIPIDDRRVVTHRVIDVTQAAGGSVTVQTKGDANENLDPWQATLSGDTAWQVQAVIPEIGTVVQALRAPVVTEALLYGAPALLAGWLLLSIWRPREERTGEDAEGTDPAVPADIEPGAIVDPEPTVEPQFTATPVFPSRPINKVKSAAKTKGPARPKPGTRSRTTATRTTEPEPATTAPTGAPRC
jgi:signal peptidase I